MSALACRFCGAGLDFVVVDLGASPPSNSFIKAGDPEPLTFPLRVYFCDRCHLVQLPQYQQPAEIFSDYLYLSAYSSLWLEHVRTFANLVTERFGLGPQSLVVEIASNDGSLLKNFAAGSVPVLGIEPASNVAAVASASGIPTLSEFFGKKLAMELRDQGKRADLVVANNVLAHVPDLNDFVAGIYELLKPNGVATIEFPHLLQLIERSEFDTIYHEHFSYFSLESARTVLDAHRLTIFDVEELATHGGSLRLYVARSDSGRAPHGNGASTRILEDERRARLDQRAGYESFSERVLEAREGFREFLETERKDRKRVVGYGAPAKATTLLNYCGVTTNLLEYTVDKNPYKQGRLIPGIRIPIFAPEKIFETKPDYVVIFPWNIQDEVASQMVGIKEWGGKFVVPIPTTRILD